MAQTPGPRCKECTWIHEADSTAGTSFQGVGLSPLHAAAPELLAALRRAVNHLIMDGTHQTDAPEALAQAHAAIARSEGRE
jgi:hypothetical protein